MVLETGKRVTDKFFEKKLDFPPEPFSVTGKVFYHYNSWVTGVYMACMLSENAEEKHLRLSDYLNHI